MEYIIFPRRPLFTANQFKRLANIFDNAGQVIFGIVVVAPIIAGIDKVSVVTLLLGIVTVLVFWLMSIYFERRGESL